MWCPVNFRNTAEISDKASFVSIPETSKHKLYGFTFFYCLTVYLLKVLTSFSYSDVDAPFARWPKDQVCDWLQEQGLGLYVNMARVWISSGQTLLQASQQDLERVRGFKKYSSIQVFLCVPSDDVMCNPHLCMLRNWASSTRCTERSCSWLCRPSAQRRRTIRESWTITGWQVSISCQSKIYSYT